MQAPEPPPGNGIAALVAGGIFTGLGFLNLATSPVCLGVGDERLQKPCLIVSVAVGVTFLVVGVPLLIVGGDKRRVFKEWQATHPGVGGLGFSGAGRAGTLTWTAQF